MTLLNLAILQINTHCAQAQVDSTLQLFYQYYAQRSESVSSHGELDASMLDIANKLKNSSILYTHNNENIVRSTVTSAISRKEATNKDSSNS